MNDTSLYSRLGGYDAVAAVVDDFLPRLQGDEQLGRFWLHRGEDGVAREKQLLTDFLCANAGGPVYYTGRDMRISHRGMRISSGDWQRLIGHLTDTLNKFEVPEAEKNDVLGFVESTRDEIVEVES
ncbi:MAG: group 1 truncated hemoglobin [Planctomycetes bacterium]|nr:group 1 truncated hemoglobin [Planctomycetota bacterium]